MRNNQSADRTRHYDAMQVRSVFSLLTGCETRLSDEMGSPGMMENEQGYRRKLQRIRLKAGCARLYVRLQSSKQVLLCQTGKDGRGLLRRAFICSFIFRCLIVFRQLNKICRMVEQRGRCGRRDNCNGFATGYRGRGHYRN